MTYVLARLPPLSSLTLVCDEISDKPRVWRYLERDLTHPALGPVARWFEDNIPPAMRGDPQELA